MTNTRNTPIESARARLSVSRARDPHPARERRRGRRRGGDGIERVIELLEPARVTVISDRRVGAPYGLDGGEPGARGENRVARAPGQPGTLMPGKFQVDLPAGAVLTLASPGGGGFGRIAEPKPSSRRVASSRAQPRRR